MTDASNSGEPGHTSPFHGFFAAGCAAAFVSSMVVVISAPSLTRPLYPGLMLTVVVPFFSAAIFCGIAGLIGRLFSKSAEVPTVPAMIGALLGATPWLLVAGAPIARATWVAWLGLVMVLLLARQNAKRGWMTASIGLPIAILVMSLESDQTFHPESSETMSPLVVLGLDSATWGQIDPMIAEGELPNMKKLLDRSARAQLDSEKPTLSARIWTIIATGRTAEDNGILDFECTRRDLKTGRVWDAVHESNGSVGLTGWLMTWPPDEFTGFCMPGWVAPGPETYPMNLAFLKPLVSVGRRDISLFSSVAIRSALSGVAVSSADHMWENLGHFFHVASTAFESGQIVRDKNFWRMQLVFANLSSDAWFEQMIRYNPVFGALLITPVDTLGHHYWSSHEPGMFPDLEEEKKLAFAEVLRNGYRKADDVLGKLMDRVDMEKTTFMIFSDHGMEALTNGGRTTAKPSPGKMLEFIDLEGVPVRAAVAGNQLVLTCNEDSPEANYEILKDVKDRIAMIRVEEKPEGRPFRFSEFNEGDQTLSMDFLQGEIGNIEYHLVFEGERKAVADLFYQESRSGVHHERGIVIISGPGVKPGTTFENASIYDAAPTMLYGLGLEIPEGLPGKVLTDAWDPAYLAGKPVQSKPGFLPEPPAAEEMAINEDMRTGALRQIGYLPDGKPKKE